MMGRREFIILLGGTAVAGPLNAHAQQPALPTIGVLGFWESPRQVGNGLVAFREGLAAAGFVDGQNVIIEYRAIYQQYDRLRALAAELVRHPVNVIVAGGFTGPVQAAKSATSTIPIVFAYGGDPVRDGFVASLNRPGGNITGAAAINSELGGKRLGLLCDLVPQATTIAFLSGPYQDQRNQLLTAARDLGRQLVNVEIRYDGDYEAAFMTVVDRQAGALIVAAHPLNRNKIVELAARHKIPAIYPRSDYVQVGGLMSYSVGYSDVWRRAGVYTGRILKGEKPADLPVSLPTKFELAINLKTAKELGLKIPRTLLALADEVIE